MCSELCFRIAIICFKFCKKRSSGTAIQAILRQMPTTSKCLKKQGRWIPVRRNLKCFIFATVLFFPFSTGPYIQFFCRVKGPVINHTAFFCAALPPQHCSKVPVCPCICLASWTGKVWKKNQTFRTRILRNPNSLWFLLQSGIKKNMVSFLFFLNFPCAGLKKVRL